MTSTPEHNVNETPDFNTIVDLWGTSGARVDSGW